MGESENSDKSNDSNISKPSWDIGHWIFFGIAGLFAAGIVYGLAFPKSAEEIKIENELAAKYALEVKLQQRSQLGERITLLCHEQAVCEKFGAVRQECATAGNFQNCINVKMGDEDAGLTDMCSTDGKLAYLPPDMPNWLNCFGRNKLGIK